MQSTTCSDSCAALDDFDRRLLDLLQGHFAVSERPYLELAGRLNCTESRVLERVRHLYEQGFIRRLGASIDSRRLGYAGVLAALQVDDEYLPEVSRVVNGFAGVTHNYLREHKYNMWFTVLASDQAGLDRILAAVGAVRGVRDVLALPAKRVFKINVKFSLTKEWEA